MKVLKEAMQTVHSHKTDLKDGKQQRITTTFDFSDCTEEDFLEMSTKFAVIACRRMMRESTKQDVDGMEINVKDLILAQRQKVDTATKISREFAKLNQEEKAALLAQLRS